MIARNFSRISRETGVRDQKKPPAEGETPLNSNPIHPKNPGHNYLSYLHSIPLNDWLNDTASSPTSPENHQEILPWFRDRIIAENCAKP